MPWDALKYVGSGLTLAAFVVAAIAWLLKSKSEEKERLIDLAKDDERAGLVRDALEFFSVDTAGACALRNHARTKHACQGESPVPASTASHNALPRHAIARRTGPASVSGRASRTTGRQARLAWRAG